MFAMPTVGAVVWLNRPNRRKRYSGFSAASALPAARTARGPISGGGFGVELCGRKNAQKICRVLWAPAGLILHRSISGERAMANESWRFGGCRVMLEAANAIDSPTALGELSSALEAAFGSQFSLLDAETGDVLAAAADHARFDWTLHAELCREVGRATTVEWIEDVDPLVLLAIPLEDRGGRALVAVGAFLTGSKPASRRRRWPAGWASADADGQLAAAGNSLATRTARAGAGCWSASLRPSGRRKRAAGKLPTCRATWRRPTKKSACSIT